jgi:tetratricopeptide (TPR) repeat protein
MARRRHIAILVAVVAWAAAAQAQIADPVVRARTHFEAGRALYQLGDYTQALREFAAGYQLAPRPQFLLNLGQCYRKLDELGQARDMYRRYLHDAPATDPERPQARQILAEIEEQLGERQAASTSPSLLPAANAVVAAAPPPRRPWIKRNWWVIPVGATVLAVAVGVGTYYGTRSDPCSGANLACWDLSK